MMKFKQKQTGVALLIFVLFFAFSSGALMFTLHQSIYVDLADLNRLTDSKRAFIASEGIVEDVVYRNIYGTFNVSSVEQLTLAGVVAYATTTYDSPSDEYTIVGGSRIRTVSRKAEALLTLGAGSAFNYGLQAGNGGIVFNNSSSVYGNVYSNGPVIQGVGSGGTVYGDLVSAGPSGLAQDIHATGTIRANTIDHIDADKDAHYNVQVGTNPQNPVGGTRYTPAANQPLVSLPISTTTVQEWKDAVINNGTTITAADPLCSTGTYTIDTSITIGYLKVECHLDIKKTGAGITVTVDGPVWVMGNLSFTQGPTIRVAPSLGRRSVQFLADNPSNRLTSSKIEVRNATDFNGSGDDRSYIMLMSLNESASLSGSEKAINVSQKANGDVLVYAGSGLIDVGNNIDLRAVTAHTVTISNGSSVTYESGLSSLLFTSGPGAGYKLSDWKQSK